MPFFCQYCVLFGQFACLKMKKISIRTISGTLGHAWLVSVYVHIAEVTFYTPVGPNVIENVTEIPERTKIEFKIILLWTFTSKRQKSVLIAFFSGQYQKKLAFLS